MRRSARLGAALVALALAVAGCGGSDGGDSSVGDDLDHARQFLPAKTSSVVTVDLRYDEDQWLQIKRLYARAAGNRAIRAAAGIPLPPTLDGALGLLSGQLGLDFQKDVRPLLDGTLVIGTQVTPARAMPPADQALVERVDQDRSTFDERGQLFFDRQGRMIRDVPTREIQRVLRRADEAEPVTQSAVVLRVGDPAALTRVLRRLASQGLEPKPLPGAENARLLTDDVALVGGDTIVGVIEQTPANMTRKGNDLLLERLKGPGAPKAALPSPDGDPPLLSVRATHATLGGLLDADRLRIALQTKQGRALRSVAATLRLTDEGATGDARVDFEGLGAEELPLPEPRPLRLPKGVGLGSASAEQSRTTVFLASLTRAVFPRSAFVRRVTALERKERLRFDDAVLRQFAGPSQSVLRPTRDGATRFGARSALRDPAEMRRLLPRIAPSLPGILDGLEGLGSTGLAGLLLVAPDAPLTPRSFGILGAVRVKPLKPRDPSAPPDAVLFEVTGLQANQAGVDRVVYGVVGEQFVVGSDERIALEAARVPDEDAPPAGTRLRLDVSKLLSEAGLRSDDAGAALLRALVTGAEAHASAQDGDIVGRLEVRAAGR